MLKHELIEILSTLMSKNNEQRRYAENYFIQQQDENLYELITLLLNILRDIEVDLLIRSLSGILLRRIIDTGTVNGVQIDDSSLIAIRNELLDIWVNETNVLMLRRVSHVIAQTASSGNWVELIPSLLAHGGSFSGRSLIALLNLLEIIAEYCPGDILTHLSNLVSFLGPHMMNDDVTVQIACAKTVGACIVSVQDDGALETFKPALQLIIRNLGNALNRGDELDAVAIMEYLVAIAQSQPLFFKGAMDNIVEAMVTVAGSDGLEFPTRSIALELMVTLTETAPALARRCTGLVNGLVPLAMNLMLEIEENDDEWASQEYTEFPPDESAVIGEEAIERAAAGMGRALIPPIVQMVQQFSGNSDSRYRRAAIAALSRLAEGATEIFKKEYLEMTIPFIAQSLSDSSPRVCFQAIQAIGQFANLYPRHIPVMIKNYLDILVEYMGNTSLCERVRGHAVSALINLCSLHDENENDDASGLLLSPEQLDRLLSVLCSAMENTSINIQPACLLLLG